MPMQYPPLADGAYRYGDEPRPLPSPVPGPDADPAEFHTATLPYAPDGRPHVAMPHPADVPPQPGGPPQPDPSEQPGEEARKRKRDKLAAAAIVGAAAIVVVVFLGLSFLGTGSGPTTTSPRGPGGGIPGAPPAPAPAPGGAFAVDGRFTVVSSPGEPVSGDASGCDLPITLSDIGEDSAIVLSDSTGTRIDRSGLAYEGGDLSSCTFTFDFPEVPAGEGSYLIELDGRGRLVYSEQELRAGVEITLGR